MKIYLSGNMAKPVQKFVAERGGCRLLSFAYQNDCLSYLNFCLENNMKSDLILDSGAFTAWSKGKAVLLRNLISFYSKVLDKYGHLVDFHFISLDVIPGSKNVTPTVVQLDEAVAQSIDNYFEMKEKFGDRILPVFHQGEHPRFLEMYKGCTNYICISPRNDLQELERVAWCQQMQDPAIKIHGLATTGNLMMNKVQWYSVDSATWAMTAAYGGIFYLTEEGWFKVIGVSQKSGKKNQLTDIHYNNLPPPQKERLLAQLNAKGFCPDKMGWELYERMKWNASIFIDYTCDSAKNFCKPIMLFN